MPRYRLLKVELNRDYRNDLNKNFEDIERDIVKAETNIKRVETETLQKVEEIVGGGFIESLENARDSANESSVEANTQASYAKTQGDYAKTQGDLANGAALNAESKAEYAEEKAILADEAAAKAELEASNLGTLKTNVVDATQIANNAATNAEEKVLEVEIAVTDTIAATHAANEATEAVQEVVDNTGYFEPYSDDTAYKRNNIVSYNGSSYMAKQDTQGNLPTDTTHWGLLAEKGEQGTGLNILGSLNDDTELPSTGELGNAYLINGYLFVWDGTSWQNAGNIKGPKGDTGERGLKGDKGDKGDQGIQGVQGLKGDTGPQGPQPPLNNTVTSTSTTQAATANVAKVLNDKVESKLPISGGLLENYAEKVIELTGTSTSINLNDGSVFNHTLTGNTTYSITNTVNSEAHSFTLIISQATTVRTVTFPANVRWQNGEVPNLTTANKVYILTFMTVTGGTTWFGMIGGEF